MHRLFRQALDDATGESKFVIVVFVDIRGFSAFSQRCESPDTAMFIKRVYMKMIDTYFSFASFYKSTGEGLLLTIPFTEKTLEEMSQKTVESCIACHSEFGDICKGDPMIYFSVPDKVGIGVARGTACCLASGDTTIDYSGRLLNLASRLTGLARPSGIVIDGNFGINILSEELKGNFGEERVYLDGIAEEEPIEVYFTKEFTTIPKRNRQPIAEKRWRHVIDVKLFRDILNLRRFRYNLVSEPLSSDDIKVTVQHEKVIGGKVSKNYLTYHDIRDFTYKIDAGKPVVFIDFPGLSEKLKQGQVKKNMNVTIDVAYVEK